MKKDIAARRVVPSWASFERAGALRGAVFYERWGRGLHPAGLNFGDCFAHEVAMKHSCRLLFVGDDFSKTDVGSVL